MEEIELFREDFNFLTWVYICDKCEVSHESAKLTIYFNKELVSTE